MEGNCSTHPNNAAVAVCARCGDFVCAVCRTAVDGKIVCVKCFELLYARGGLAFAQRTFQSPVYALVCSICALITTWACLGFLLVPPALYFGVTSLKEIKRRPELPGRTMAIWSIVLSVLSIVLAVGFWVGIGFLAWLSKNTVRK